jgi:hypothetical protein
MPKVEAISPEEVVAKKKSLMPDEAIEAFNEMIAENLSCSRASVRQDEVVKRMVSKGLKKNEIYEKGWLDVEEIFRAKGWKVAYDKPGYNESYEAYFVFSAKRD